MTTPRFWWLHGLLVSTTDMDLDARRVERTREPDVVVGPLRRAEVPRYGESVAGRVMAYHDYGDSASLTVVELEEPGSLGMRSHAVHFHDLASVYIGHGGASVDVDLAPGADQRLVPILLSGTVMSTILVLRGQPVMHASAVVVRVNGVDAAIALLGHSGMGKSTLATLMCRDGARLLGDDVLRTDILTDGSVVAWPGATSTRLRSSAASLSREIAEDAVETADGRTSASPMLSGSQAVPLLAVVVPQPDRAAHELSLTAVRGIDAVLTLVQFPRLLGWRDQETSRQALSHWGTLARTVPVYTAQVPWGPPFAPGLGADLARALGAGR